LDHAPVGLATSSQFVDPAVELVALGGSAHLVLDRGVQPIERREDIGECLAQRR
jgi:hypothetical protein